MKTISNKHTFYNYQFKWTAVTLANHPDIQGRSVAEALDIHPIMLYRWKKEMRDGELSDNGKETRSKRSLEPRESGAWQPSLIKPKYEESRTYQLNLMGIMCCYRGCRGGTELTCTQTTRSSRFLCPSGRLILGLSSGRRPKIFNVLQYKHLIPFRRLLSAKNKPALIG